MLFWPLVCRIIPRDFQFVCTCTLMKNRTTPETKTNWDHSPLSRSWTRQYDVISIGIYFDKNRRPSIDCSAVVFPFDRDEKWKIFLIKNEKKSVFIFFAGRISNYLSFIAKIGWERLISRGKFMKNFLTTTRVYSFSISDIFSYILLCSWLSKRALDEEIL